MKIATITTVNGVTVLRCYDGGALVFTMEVSKPHAAQLLRSIAASL